MLVDNIKAEKKLNLLKLLKLQKKALKHLITKALEHLIITDCKLFNLIYVH